MKLNSNNVFIACIVLIIMLLTCQADKLFSKKNDVFQNTKSKNSGSYCLSNKDITNPDTNQIYKINRNSPCYRSPVSNYKYRYQFKKNERETLPTQCQDPCPYLNDPHAEIPKSVIHKCGLNNSKLDDSGRQLDANNGLLRDNLTLNDYRELLKKYEQLIKIKGNTFERQ